MTPATIEALAFSEQLTKWAQSNLDLATKVLLQAGVPGEVIPAADIVASILGAKKFPILSYRSPQSAWHAVEERGRRY